MTTDPTNLSSAPAPADTEVDTLASLVSQLDPEKLARLRHKLNTGEVAKVLGANLAKAAQNRGLRRLPDGSVAVEITISADTVPVLESWAESAGCSLQEQIQQIAESSITSYCFQSWGDMQQVPAPVVAGGSAAAVAAGAGAGAPVVPPPAAAVTPAPTAPAK